MQGWSPPSGGGADGARNVRRRSPAEAGTPTPPAKVGTAGVPPSGGGGHNGCGTLGVAHR